MIPSPSITKTGVFDIQVCVPKDWTDQMVTEFANKQSPTGTANGWRVRKQSDYKLAEALERVDCSILIDHVHIMLDC